MQIENLVRASYYFAKVDTSDNIWWKLSEQKCKLLSKPYQENILAYVFIVANAIWNRAERMCPWILPASGLGEAWESDVLRKPFHGKIRGARESESGDADRWCKCVAPHFLWSCRIAVGSGSVVPISAVRVFTCSASVQAMRKTKWTFPHCLGKHMEGWVGRVWEGKEIFHPESAQSLLPAEKPGFQTINRIYCEGCLHTN